MPCHTAISSSRNTCSSCYPAAEPQALVSTNLFTPFFCTMQAKWNRSASAYRVRSLVLCSSGKASTTCPTGLYVGCIGNGTACEQYDSTAVVTMTHCCCSIMGCCCCCCCAGLIAVNYAARAAGITRHMRVHEARQICPELELVHVQTIGDQRAARCPTASWCTAAWLHGLPQPAMVLLSSKLLLVCG